MVHDHSHKSKNHSLAFIIGILLNVAFVVIEIWFGYSSHSLALVSDAVHNLTDVFGLLISWAGIWFAMRQPSGKHTYGYGRGSILTSLFNAILIFVAAGGIFVEALHRINAPQTIMGSTVMWVAISGIVINGVTALLFMRDRKSDINIRGAFVHMAVDAGVSFGVVIAGLLITLTGFVWIDPVISIVIAGVIILTTWSLMRESLNLSLDAVPESIDQNEVKKYLLDVSGVVAVHDLHIWAISTKETGLTAHLIYGDTTVTDEILMKTADDLREKFHIGHTTLQTEKDRTGRYCKLEPDTIV